MGSAQKIVQAALDHFGGSTSSSTMPACLRDQIFHRMTAEDWLTVISVHLNGSFFVSRAAADQYRKQESGAFIHITSTSGLIGNMGQANYASAKLGITALSKAIAIDMKRFNVRSNCLSPWAWSRMTQSIPARTEEEQARVAKIQQMTPDKNAPMAVFLASRRGARGDRPGLRDADERDISSARRGRSAACTVPPVGPRRRSPSMPCRRSSPRSCRSIARATRFPGTRYRGADAQGHLYRI
jgi:NAD(P)-dependent dehydrogenase (short-subunit alcohol dehydrogenase family)